MAQKEEMPKIPTFPFGPPCVSTDWMDWINYCSHIHFPRWLNLVIWVIHPSSHVSIYHFQPLWRWIMMQASWRVFRMFRFWHISALLRIQAKWVTSRCTKGSLLSWICQEDPQKETSTIDILVWLPKPPQLTPVKKRWFNFESGCSHLWDIFVLFPSKVCKNYRVCD